MKKTRFTCSGIVFIFSQILIIGIQGCASHSVHKLDSRWVGYTEKGKASYYSMKFQFRRTASGARFNNYSMTAAHKKLPFGTKVLVTNIKNGKKAEVIINDRGPFIKGRIIDLTRMAFSKIENLKKGVTAVEIKVID